MKLLNFRFQAIIIIFILSQLSMNEVLAAREYTGILGPACYPEHEQKTIEKIDDYQKAANQGNIDAMNHLGLIYESIDTYESYYEAIKWYQKAADRGSVEAMVNLGLIYKKSDDYEGYSKAIEWYKKAAQLGDFNSYFAIASMYLEGNGVAQNTNKAIDWYKKLIKDTKNHEMETYYSITAQNLIGTIYFRGEGVNKNISEAIKWYQKAADLEDIEAQLSLVSIYRSNDKRYQNYRKAFNMLQKILNEEYSARDANYQLGLMYYNGEGVIRDIHKAAELFQKAADDYHIEANKMVKLIYSNNEAINNVEAQGYPEAQKNIGSSYKNSHVLNRDYAEAHEWYQKAANQGDPESQYNLATFYCEDFNRNGYRDARKAVQWFERAAKQGHGGAALVLGDMYYRGAGVNQDYSKALKWFELSANLGYAQAQMITSEMYSEGIGTQRDPLKARELKQQAIHTASDSEIK